MPLETVLEEVSPLASADTAETRHQVFGASGTYQTGVLATSTLSVHEHLSPRGHVCREILRLSL